MSNKSPKVSVITGYYNRSYALELTIDSIMEQSFSDFELIVFNDCSTDDTKEKLKEIERKYNDERLIIINHEHNKGFVQGMIDAIEASRGKYICVQGSGDYSFPTRLEEQVKVLDSNSEIGVVGSYYENYVETTGVSRKRYKDANGITFEKLLKENIYSHGEVMYRRTSYENAGGYRPEFINCQDYDLWLRMIRVTKFSSVKEFLYRRYVRYDGVSYEPNKYLKQIRYVYLCRKLAYHHGDCIEKELLGNLKEQGVLSCVDSESVKRDVLKGIARSLVWGEAKASSKLCKLGIKPIWQRKILLFVIELYSSNLFYPIRKRVNAILKVESR